MRAAPLQRKSRPGKRMSGIVWERGGERRYFLQRWPSSRSMRRVRQRVRELTPRGRCHADIREVIADLDPVIRGWGNYFRTGNAAQRFNQLDSYVWRLGLHRLRGTVEYPETVHYREPERPPVSRVREIRTHGLKGGLARPVPPGRGA